MNPDSVGIGCVGDGPSQLRQELRRLRDFADEALLPRAFGQPAIFGQLRCHAEDFRVVEHTGIEPVGTGEHLWLRLRKTGQNTVWVANQLARLAGIPRRDVSFAGLKDRHAITEQWFSLRLPGQVDPDWQAWQLPGTEILQATRHDRKLRQGQVSYNRFDIVIRNLREVGPVALEARVAQIADAGVPNYFGPQRFGHQQGNLQLAAGAAELRKLGREQRGFAISALRSALFNGYLARRVIDANWDRVLPDEYLQSDRARGSNEADRSVFSPGRVPMGLLWGKGGRQCESTAAEQAWYAGFPAVCGLLEQAGAEAGRRPLRAAVAELSVRRDADSLHVHMALGPGSFATVVLRELVDFEDAASPLRLMAGAD